MKSERAKPKENADDFEMRVEYVRHAFSILAGRCYSRVSGKCEHHDKNVFVLDCTIRNCPLLREVEKLT